MKANLETKVAILEEKFAKLLIKEKLVMRPIIKLPTARVPYLCRVALRILDSYGAKATIQYAEVKKKG